ncbi:MAG: YgjV family protein [Campylobacteraceae bacterium]|nr:YgjV family protein [Campylobacteraceae bacterium]
MTDFLLSQIFVGIAICFDITSFQFKDRRKIIMCFFFASIFIGLHFLLLEQYTAASLAVVAALRFVSSIFTSSKKLMSVFLIACAVVTFFTYAGILSIFSYLGASINTIASFCKKDEHLRLIMMIGTLFWIVNNYFANSPAAVFMESLFLCSNIIGYYRHYIKPKRVLAKVSNK